MAGPRPSLQATGITLSTIDHGFEELTSRCEMLASRNRRAGGGRKTLTQTNPALLDGLRALVSPGARDDPMSPLRWTCNSLRGLASELRAMGYKTRATVGGELLKSQKFGLQASSKTQEGDSHPDRDAQFVHINASVSHSSAEQQPVISVDTKEKELVGDFENAGLEWRPQGGPDEVRAHDFLIEKLGRTVPYGIYDLAANAVGSAPASTTTRLNLPYGR
jgi:hypothetical protein